MSEARLSLDELMERVRSAIGGRDFVTVSLSKLDFAHVCAAADALQDAEAALFEFHAEGVGVDGSYLRLYGVLQAAQLQQDCLEVLRQAFLMPPLESRPAGMEALRELRNRSIGHPAEPNPKRRSKTPATAIARYSLEGGHLELWRTEPSGESTHQRLDLAGMLQQHSSDLLDLLTALVAEIAAKEQAFREQQRKIGRTAGLLHPTWTYSFSKIREEAHDEHRRSGSALRFHTGMLQDAVAGVVAGLSERGLRPIYEWHVDTADRALRRLQDLSDQLDAGVDVELEILAFAELAEKHFRDVAAHLNAIDERLEEQA